MSTLPAQRTGFNTLDNWGHKTPTQSKRIKDRNKRLKSHGPEHLYIHSVTFNTTQEGNFPENLHLVVYVIVNKGSFKSSHVDDDELMLNVLRCQLTY